VGCREVNQLFSPIYFFSAPIGEDNTGYTPLFEQFDDDLEFDELIELAVRINDRKCVRGAEFRFLGLSPQPDTEYQTHC